MADTMGSLRELLLRRVQAEHVSGLSALLGFSTGLAGSVKEVLAQPRRLTLTLTLNLPLTLPLPLTLTLALTLTLSLPLTRC